MEVNSYQKAIARKIGSTFQYATECGYDICEFVHAWLESNVCFRIFHENPIDLAQWAPYQLDSLLIELKEQGKSISKSDINLPDEMYWLGYTLTYWGFQDKLTGKELSQCDVIWLINQYDVLHTTSTEFFSKIRRKRVKIKRKLEIPEWLYQGNMDKNIYGTKKN